MPKNSVKIDPSLLEKFTIPNDRFKTQGDVLKMKGYQLGEKIGSGSFGVVWRLFKIPDKVSLAVKKIDMSKKPLGKMERYLKNEIFTLIKCKHRNVIEIKDSFIINFDAYIVMEYANGGSLSRFVKKPQTESTARKFFLQILQGLLYLHQNGIAHRDIKSDNILLVYRDNICTAKLTDFGLSKVVYYSAKGYIEPSNFAGTRHYMAPEILRIRVFPELGGFDINSRQFPADFWALGVCLFEWLTAKLPFTAYTEKELLRLQETRSYEFPSDCRPSESCQDLLSKIFDPDSETRIDAFGMLTHEWILIDV